MVLLRGDAGARRSYGAAARAGLIVLATCIALVALSGGVYGKDDSSAPTDSAQSQPSKSSPAVSIGKTPSRYVYPYRCEHPKDAEQDNLCTGRKAADAAVDSAILARNTFYIGVIGTAAVLCTLIATAWAAWAAHRAANAAKEAANALPIVERAYVYPVILTAGPLNDVISTARVFYLNEGKEDVPAAETAEITFHIKNFGKTPAIIKGIFAEFGVGPFESLTKRTAPESILGPGEVTSEITVQMQRGLTRNQAINISVHTATFAFTGFVNFLDIWGIEHETDFFFGWDMEIRKMILRELQDR